MQIITAIQLKIEKKDLTQIYSQFLLNNGVSSLIIQILHNRSLHYYGNSVNLLIIKKYKLVKYIF